MKEKNRKIAIISRESNSKTLDVAMLETELRRRGCDVVVLSKLLTKEKSLKALGYMTKGISSPWTKTVCLTDRYLNLSESTARLRVSLTGVRIRRARRLFRLCWTEE